MVIKNSFCSDCEVEGVNIKGLRSELTTVVERSRMGDLRQLELEHSITRMQEELSSKTARIIELDERVSDRTSLVDTLETKLKNRNEKITELQKRVEKKEEDHREMEKEVGLFMCVCSNRISFYCYQNIFEGKQ